MKTTENQKPESAPRFVDLRDVVGIRFGCERCSARDSLPRDHVSTALMIGKFISDHIHKEGGSIGTAHQDIQTLNTILSRFLTEDLPQLSEIINRRKLAFEFEVVPDQRFR